ncbi:hypothetical protein DNU06_01775 [Putridiphycobacter roseus]|uniref:Uncharacterized protein n=1 Tax=Putridiphycobacter roseus TaxID=2219161 RepID=A0A2W1N412_9FLAO|nr:hypothetical protein [Putridiphycobacter roseus]PZE18584.1 hypothetical protein DNU06_01775 [Putridiphycobacter roseus]
MKQLLLLMCLCFSIASINTACHKIKANPAEPIDLTPKLPQATHIGANTFGCYINGALFIAQSNNYNKVIPIYCSYNKISENELRIQGSRLNDSVRDNVRFIAFIDKGVGAYEMDVTGDNQDGYNIYTTDSIWCFDYNFSLTEKGMLDITFLDTVDRIISGNFQMQLYNEDCPLKIVSITDGRFDLKY